MAEGMTFLPDEAEIELSGGVGIVSAPMEALHALAGAAPRKTVDEKVWRGLLALCFLADAWQDGPHLTVKTISPEASGFTRAVLSKPVSLVMLGDKLLGVLDAAWGVIPAAQMDELSLPARVKWYSGVFADPTDMLCEQDRLVLLRRLSVLNQHGESLVQRFMASLNQAGMRVAHPVAHQEEQAMAALQVRMKAILGGLPGVTEKKTLYAGASVNPLLTALGLEEKSENVEPAVTWSYRGQPFARSCSAVAFEAADAPEQEKILAAMAREIDLLERYHMREKTVLTSFNFESIREAKAYAPQYRVGLLYGADEPDPLEKIQSVGGEQLCPHAAMLTKEMVDRYHALGLNVRAWGVKDQALMKHVIACGADGMTVNFPDVLAAYLKEAR